ncbi:MAG: tyrosine-protein phosphatase [Tannerellaceae bacterium]|nr:tyrosine-protein phosphatase [Tannerellaceae bacterium]
MVRMYYQLDTRAGRAILAERHLPMRGGYNFRDLGGIRNKEGKYVKWGKLFRSDEMKDLTKEDVIYLNSIPLVTVVDFRSGEEIEESPDVLPDSVRAHYILSITPGNLGELSMQDITSLSAEQSIGIMEAINRQFVTDPACIDQYKQFFSLLQNEENLLLLFHCTAGKDRTGIAAYLFLTCLNVEEKDILNDYLSSNMYLQDKYGAYIKQYPALAPLLEVKPEYLKAGIEAIRQNYGTTSHFLENYLMVDLKKMRDIYLY